MNMTDIEIITLCAEAMGYTIKHSFLECVDVYTGGTHSWTDHERRTGGTERDVLTYSPIKDKEQLMELIIKFDIEIRSYHVAIRHPEWARSDIPDLQAISTADFNERADIPRAICTVVAEMQKAARAKARKNNAT